VKPCECEPGQYESDEERMHDARSRQYATVAKAIKEGESFLAHAWPVSGGRVVIGGHGLESYTPLETLDGSVTLRSVTLYPARQGLGGHDPR